MSDLAVAYRVYPGVSKTPAVFPADKLNLSLLCFDSFCGALGGLAADVTVLLDGCPDIYERRFCEIGRQRGRAQIGFVRTDHEGNLATFGRQIEILLAQQESSYVMFAEDDYFYLPGGIEACLRLLAANRDVHFVTPYDHLDYYTNTIHRRRRKMVFSGHHFQEVDTTCLTFLTRATTLAEHARVFRSYCRGNFDYAMWMILTKGILARPWSYVTALINRDRFFMHIVRNVLRHGWKEFLFDPRRSLYSPVPTVATHLESEYLAPGVAWTDRFAESIDRLGLGT